MIEKRQAIQQRNEKECTVVCPFCETLNTLYIDKAGNLIETSRNTNDKHFAGVYREPSLGYGCPYVYFDSNEQDRMKTVLEVLARHLGIAQRERVANPDCQYTFSMLREVEEIIEQIGVKGLLKGS